MATTDKAAKLKEFTAWAAAHIKGDEKGEAQVFLDRLFKAFGHHGWMEAGATCEKRLKNDSGGTSFADLVWKPVVVIEMKKRGADLTKHYSQAFTYWTRLVPDRPRFAVLCNFDEFWVYDFNTQMDTPVDKIKLAELPKRYGPLNFLFPGDVAPVFNNHHEAVTRQAADKLAACFNSMLKRKVDRELAQQFILQMLMALFSEDIGLLDKYFVTQLLDECKTQEDTYDKLGGLFAAMNNKAGNKGGRYKGVAYFNGGLFAAPAQVELIAEERSLLKEASQFDWSTVRPEIFGTIFEHSLGKAERHATGAHYTTPVDIMKIVGPTIVEPWREAIDNAKTLTEMQKLVNRMQTFTVLDPACGSGNFLFTAYREMKRLEADLYNIMAEKFKSVNPLQRQLGFVTTTNFYGLDVNPFAVEIAKVTMMLAHKLSIDELHVSESALPLDNLDANIQHRDALVTEDGSRAPWPKADVIIGNPPFLGSKKIRRELGGTYTDMVWKAYPDVPRMADFCVYWIKRANDALASCTAAEPFAGRAGLVGTQNIRSNASRIGGLDSVAETGTIVDTVNSQPWSGEAVVQVSIVNWVKTKDEKLLPTKRRLWFVAKGGSKVLKLPKGAGPSAKRYNLDMREVSSISSSLSDSVDVSQAKTLDVNKGVVVSQGITPGHKDFLLSTAARAALIASEAKSASIVHPYLVGDDVLGNEGKASRWLIDFGSKNILEAQAFPKALKHLQLNVLPAMQKAEEKGTERASSIDRWWQHWRGRSDLLVAISKIPRYLVCSRVTKRPIFAFVDSRVRPGDAVQAFALPDDYSFGILQSKPHYLWFQAKCSNMRVDPRYSSESIFHTFPWPQEPTAAQIRSVADAAVALRHVRSKATADIQGGLRVLYRTLELPGKKNPLKDAHDTLDKAVLAAYGFSAAKDLLKQLLDLNHHVAALIELGKPVVGSGVPASYKKAKELTTADCIGL